MQGFSAEVKPEGVTFKINALSCMCGWDLNYPLNSFLHSVARLTTAVVDVLLS